jgi:hypothetical protein
MPDMQNYVLARAVNALGKMMVVVARKPSIDGELRGQFDDIIGIQLLRNRFAILAMEAAEKSVQAPLILPDDIDEIQMGADAVIRTKNPAGARRLELNIPPGAFTEQEILNQELRVGARYPEGRTGNIDASVVTGQGVQALMGAFDTQVKSAQAIFASALREVIKICFRVDEMVYPEQKTIRGVDAGSPYEVKYNPEKDVAGDYTADVRYGMLAGLNPAQGLIFMLQALGGGLVSVDMAMRELPFGINVTQEQEKIEIEGMRKALISSIQAYAQSIPQMASQGQDPSKVVKQFATVIKERKAGKTIEDAIEIAFAPEEPPAGTPTDAVEQPQVPAGAPAGGAPLGDGGPSIPPDLQTALNSMRGDGSSESSVRNIRQTAI